MNRRARRAKTDRLDAVKLVRMLVRVCLGSGGVWREVRVPTVAEEAARHVSRERTALMQEQTRLINQMRSWLATWGCTPADAARPRVVDDGPRLGRRAVAGRGAGAAGAGGGPPGRARGAARGAGGASSGRGHGGGAPESALRPPGAAERRGDDGASVLLDEGLVWREFRNRRQMGGLLGFSPTPYDSGESQHEQGISRAGNPRLQAVSIQLAWSWVRWQPLSALTRWFQQRFATAASGRGALALSRSRANCDRVVAVCDDRRGARRRDPETRVGRRVTRLTRAARTVPCWVAARPPQRRCRSPRVRLRLNSLWGPREFARARIEGERWVRYPWLIFGPA